MNNAAKRILTSLTTIVNNLTLKLMPSHSNHKKSGFTLIELLVVISIIGILASFIVASFTSAQKKARDSKRKADLDAVKKALTLASNDCSGGGFPSIGGLAAAGDVRYADNPSPDNLMYYLNTNKYIQKSPQDPMQTGVNRYNYNNSGTTVANVCPDTLGGRTISSAPKFLLRATLENGNDTAGSASVTQCSDSGAAAGSPPAGKVYYFVCDQ